MTNSLPCLSEYSRTEELVNVLLHAVGMLLSIIGLIALCIQADEYGTEMHMVSYVIFGSTMITLYLASTLYHSLSNTKYNSLLKKIDHLSIYFLIAGTYSPLMLVGVQSATSLLLLKVIWSLVVINCIFRLSKSVVLQRIAFANYLVMGWLVIAISDELIAKLSITSLYLLVVGGVLYTIGVVFYYWDKLPFNHSIWHGFVLGGSATHYFSIYYLLAV